jgi:N-acetylneuraminic acid mutarotase
MYRSSVVLHLMAFGLCASGAFVFPCFAAPPMVLLHKVPAEIKQGWYAGSDIPTAVNRAAAVGIEGIIYVAGGRGDSGPTNAVYAFNPSTNTWAGKASLPETLYEGDGAVELRGKIYLAGGWNGSLPTNTLYAYDPATDTWTMKATLLHLSSCGMSDKIEGKLYVTTACDGYSGYRRDFDVYDPSTDRWKRLKSSHRAHGDGVAVAIDGKLYVAGGNNGTGAIGRDTEVYDPTTDAWTLLATMPAPVAGANGFALRGLLVVIGGYGKSGDRTLIQVYDPVTGVWQKMSPALPDARSYAAGANAYGRPFVIGGSSNGATVATNLNLAIITPIP